MSLTSSSVVVSVAPFLVSEGVPLLLGIVDVATPTSLVSRNGFVAIGLMELGALTGLVEPDVILLRKGLFDAKGEAIRSGHEVSVRTYRKVVVCTALRAAADACATNGVMIALERICWLSLCIT